MCVLTKEALIRMYIDEKKTMSQIARECSVAVGTVYNYIHKFGIVARPAHTGMLGRNHSVEVKSIISQKNNGKKMSAETRTKISKAHLGKIRTPSEYGGHTKRHRNGYIMVYVPNHPYATNEGYVFEHILAYERAHNCFVDRNKYVVHHINGIKTDNRIDNLRLMTKHDHMSLHMTQRHNERRIQNG